jgi:hypothetical protein
LFIWSMESWKVRALFWSKKMGRMR